MLKRFSNNAHAHLISLLATYEQFNSYFLIFHWAEADLQQYWSKVNPNPSVDRDTVLWMAEQCKGIANGVLKIHEYVSSSCKLCPDPVQDHKVLFGHHGDIKPENVLWFPEPGEEKDKRGTLKLSDFGLAELSIHRTKSMKPKTNPAASPPYRAPEWDLHDSSRVGRSYDIWTLGCLYLEFITWQLGGWKLVEEFVEQRMSPDPMWWSIPTDTFFEVVGMDNESKSEARVKPSVSQVSLILSNFLRGMFFSHRVTSVHRKTSFP